MKKVLPIYLILLLFPFYLHSQSQKNLEELNEVWGKFYQAFDSLDYTLMAEIHSKALIRIGGGQRILDYNTYIDNYKQQFKSAKENNWPNVIALRFFERISNDSVASDRGIYRLVRNKNTENEQSFYGQFHVIFKKEDGEWKITMDYDSNEGNTIDDTSFQKSHAIDNFTPFIDK